MWGASGRYVWWLLRHLPTFLSLLLRSNNLVWWITRCQLKIEHGPGTRTGPGTPSCPGTRCVLGPARVLGAIVLGRLLVLGPRGVADNTYFPTPALISLSPTAYFVLLRAFFWSSETQRFSLLGLPRVCPSRVSACVSIGLYILVGRVTIQPSVGMVQIVDGWDWDLEDVCDRRAAWEGHILSKSGFSIGRE